MDDLSTEDLRAILDCAYQLYGHHDFETFPRFLIEVLPGVLKGEYVAHTEVDPTGGWAPRAVMVPEVEDVEELGRRMLPLVRQHPVIMYCQETGDGTAHQISDFLTREEYHKLPLYQEFYRPMGVEDQLSIMLPAPTGTVIGLSISRAIWRFPERERGMLNALRPHLLQAYRNAAMRTQLERALRQVEGAMNEMPVGVVILDALFHAKLVTKPAERLFSSYFTGGVSGVPGEVVEYARGVAGLAKGVIPVPMTVRRERSYLVVQPVATGVGGELTLMVSDHTAGPVKAGTARAREFGLTPREGEVLDWLAEGKTNPEIGVILSISPRTVQKHLEHAFQKLSVETRSAALLRLLETGMGAR